MSNFLNHSYSKLFIGFSFFWLPLLTNAVPMWECEEPRYVVQYPVKDFSKTTLLIPSRLQEGTGIADIVMRYYDIGYAEFLGALNRSQYKHLLVRLPPHQQAVTTVSKEGCRFIELTVLLNGNRELKLFREDGKLVTRIYQLPVRYDMVYREFSIENSLFYDGAKVKVPEKMLSEIEVILAGHLDFTSDLRRGDEFRVMYEEIYKQNELIGYGRVLAMQYQQKNKKLWKINSYHAPNGHHYYLDTQGNNMLANFIRNPVKYSRISSRFSLKRRHPILHTIRKHRGVDFAAPVGTPVRATSAGVLKVKTYSPSYGNLLQIQHGSRYITVYAHLQRFVRSLKVGDRVRRGQVIAYVGSTGLSTGPHLHYEFLINGEHRDPLSIRLPSSEKLQASELINFEDQSVNLWEIFHGFMGMNLEKNSDSSTQSNTFSN